MNGSKIVLASLALLAVSIGAPIAARGQDVHFTINGQADLDFSSSEGLGFNQASVACVLCNTSSCSMDAPASARVAWDAMGDPMFVQGHTVVIPLFRFDRHEVTDFQVLARVYSDDVATTVQSYACQLSIRAVDPENLAEMSLAVGPSASRFWARPRAGTPFTGVVSGTIP